MIEQARTSTSIRPLKESELEEADRVVTMHRPNEPGYNRPGVYIIDDWR
jgi:hypothetical protein